MRLTLQNGYPYPCPEGFDSEAEGYDPRDYSVEIPGVIHFEWLHTVTVQFADRTTFNAAKEVLGWDVWSDSERILEAPTSADDGYNHPAIIVKDKAYCGFILRRD